MWRWTSSKLVLAGCLLAALALPYGIGAKGAPSEAPPSQLGATVAVAALPVQGVQTYRLILQGGPFAFDKDGVVFGNRERLLPAKARGYYHEYTVKTPGSSNRGARRIVCGGAATTPDVCYYTADHYASFSRIVP